MMVDAEEEAKITGAMARVLSDERLREDLRGRGLARAPLYSASLTSGRVLALLGQVSRIRR